MYVVFFWGGPMYLLSWTPLVPPALVRLCWGLYILLPSYGGEQVLYAFFQKHITDLELKMRKHKTKLVREVLQRILHGACWCVQTGIS